MCVRVCVLFDRFLVFFDDGYAQYSSASTLHQVYEQSKPLLHLAALYFSTNFFLNTIYMCG